MSCCVDSGAPGERNAVATVSVVVHNLKRRDVRFVRRAIDVLPAVSFGRVSALPFPLESVLDAVANRPRGTPFILTDRRSSPSSYPIPKNFRLLKKTFDVRLSGPFERNLTAKLGQRRRHRCQMPSLSSKSTCVLSLSTCLVPPRTIVSVLKRRQINSFRLQDRFSRLWNHVTIIVGVIEMFDPRCSHSDHLAADRMDRRISTHLFRPVS